MTKAKTVSAWFETVEPEMAPIAFALRKVLDEADAELATELAWGFPCWIGNERVFSIIAHMDRCNLQLWSGNRLADQFPHRIEGTGKQMRHIKVRQVNEIDEELLAIIAAAIALDQTDPERVR